MLLLIISIFGDINQPYKRESIGRIKSAINHLPRCSYHLLYNSHWGREFVLVVHFLNAPNQLYNSQTLALFTLPLSNRHFLRTLVKVLNFFLYVNKCCLFYLSLTALNPKFQKQDILKMREREREKQNTYLTGKIFIQCWSIKIKPF